MLNSYLNICFLQDSFFDAIRNALAWFCTGIYNLISGIFSLFFDICEYRLFDNKISETLFNRLFVIIGVFMFFKLCISLISYLINPESMKDKEKGIGKLFGRLITMLVLLYSLMPLKNFNLWGDTETDALYKSNGLIFGALYDLQSRVINDGTLSQLILGTDLKGQQAKNLNIGDEVAITIHSAFLADSGNCTSEAETILGSIKTKNELFNAVNKTCSNSKEYVFEYNGVVAFFVGIGVLIIVFLFSFDVAIRMLKLGILRLLSPIPAISYIDPKSSRDGMFANYVKTLTSTYLDLFLRLALIYLVIFLISNIASREVDLFGGTPSPMAKVIIYISLLFFAVQAPKFIQQALGIKSKGTGLGFGAALLGGSLAGTISGAATGGAWGAIKGTVGGAVTGSSNQWKAQNGQQRQGTAIQEARARGAVLGKGEVDPSKQGLTSMIGGWIGNKITGTTEKNLDKMKQASYANNNRKGEVDNLISNLGKTAGIGEGQSFTDVQKDLLVEAGMRIKVVDGKMQVEDRTGNILDNNGISEFLTRYSQDLDARGKVMDKNIKYLEEENGKRNVHANWKNYTAKNRVQKTDTTPFATKTKDGRHENDIRRDI